MTDISLYLGNKVLRWIAGNAMPAEPANVYLALFDGDPKGAGSEVTATIDATGRKAVSWATLASGTGNVLTSNADADFGDADSGADVSHVGLYDASSSGNLLGSHELVGGPYTITAGAPVNFPSGNITYTIGS
jgi:hypothetical protein